MLRFRRDSQLPQFLIQILHVFPDSLADNTEIMVFHLLPLRCRRPEQGTACENKVRPLQILIFIHKEIFLFRTHAGHHLGSARILVKQAYNAHRLLAHRLHRTKQGSLLIQHLPRVGAKGRRNT